MRIFVLTAVATLIRVRDATVERKESAKRKISRNFEDAESREKRSDEDRV